MFGTLSVRSILFFLTITSIVVVELAFSPPQLNVVTVEGTAVYDQRTYRDQRVKVEITEDGKHYRTIYADDRGEFQTTINFDHVYMFNLSMDYHGTSRVEMDTRVPESFDKESSGALFEFKCQMFELVEGLNTAILNRPIMKMRYIPEKNKFEYDKEYTEKIAINLEGFAARIDELKKRRKDVVKDEAELEQAVAAAPAPKKKRKVIEFESEKEKPKAENKRGHKNIMDFLNEDQEEEETEEVIAETEVTEESEEVEEETEEKEVVAEAVVEEDKLFMEEEIDESEYNSLNVVPKRISIDGDEIASAPEKKNEVRKIEIQKMKMRESQEIRRISEETKIRDQVNTYNQMVFVRREKRLSNKEVQTGRLRNMIKTIALAEVYYKKEYYQQHPIKHNEIEPSVLVHKEESTWVDREKVMVRYPNESIVFRKETYPMGFTYYYQGEREIDEETYCSKLDEISKHNYACAN